MDEPWRCVHVLALKVDPAWRRLPDDARAGDAAAFGQAASRAAERVKTYTYSMVGLRADVDLLLWRLGPSAEALEETAAGLLAAGVGRFMTVAHAMLGLVRPSAYVKKPTVQEQAMFVGERCRYLIVYPFVKTTEWYLLDREARQQMMNEHIKVGHQFPMVRQLLAYSFGLDDQEFIVAYETDDLEAFQDLVHALRATQARRYTLRDTPILTGIHRPLRTILALLGAPVAAEVRS
ncbi:MAG: chlorite dismutase family protein [Armatimonadota bacterium]|nr:chlorite dismutase family protein [Armatimonadota bacterium]MDR7519475.1 chlorite dismutase family protein [Armatimonadota bacterium]MDR7549172.1 chlorite dismutase family protein [Armatimonadota bacterium]